MATCPDCHTKSSMSLDRTSRTKLLARQIGDYSLSGIQMKVSALEVEIHVLACDIELNGCGWNTEGYIDGEHFIAFKEQSGDK